MIYTISVHSENSPKTKIELSRTYCDGDGVAFAEFYRRDYDVTVLDENYRTVDGVATIYEPKMAQALDVLIFA